jgi:hypothetical protein
MTQIPPAALPASLWRDGMYHVAPHLQDAYVEQLKKRGLWDLAKSNTKQKRIYGGESLEETHDHFALRFSASVIRVQNVLLDANSNFGTIPFEICQIFSSHSVSVLDVPCGTGAGGLALLSVIHELRKAGIIPRLPLNISMRGGDFSPHALEIYRDQVARLTPEYASSGMNINIELTDWNAMDLASTTNLYDLWEKESLASQERVMLAANFSGDGKSMNRELDESMGHLCVRAAKVRTTLLWIEPGEGDGRSFLKRISEGVVNFFLGKI